jgi:hypothetical protein
MRRPILGTTAPTKAPASIAEAMWTHSTFCRSALGGLPQNAPLASPNAGFASASEQNP